MLRIIDRYLLRELLTASAAVGIVLLLVIVGGTLSITLDRVARGVMPPTLLLSQIGLRSIDTLPLLMPLALFLGVLLAYGRLYRDSEMAVLSASGVSSMGLLKPALLVAVPLCVVLGLLSFWLGPAAVRQSDRMIDAANRSLLVVGMEAGRFVELRGRNGVVFVGGCRPMAPASVACSCTRNATDGSTSPPPSAASCSRTARAASVTSPCTTVIASRASPATRTTA